MCGAELHLYALSDVDTIIIKDLGVLCRIGVPDEERAKPQRLLITVEMQGDFSKACSSDEISQTINYFDVSRRVVDLCQTTSFKLLERLGHELARVILAEFKAESVSIKIKKFILTDARYVSFRLTRTA